MLLIKDHGIASCDDLMQNVLWLVLGLALVLLLTSGFRLAATYEAAKFLQETPSHFWMHAGQQLAAAGICYGAALCDRVQNSRSVPDVGTDISHGGPDLLACLGRMALCVSVTWHLLQILCFCLRHDQMPMCRCTRHLSEGPG